MYLLRKIKINYSHVNDEKEREEKRDVYRERKDRVRTRVFRDFVIHVLLIYHFFCL